MRKAKILTTIIIVAAIVLAAASYLLPVPPYEYLTALLITSKSEYQNAVSFLIVSTTLGLGVAALFLLGTRQGFTTAFKRCYYLITAGFAMQAVGSMVYVYSVYNGILQTDTASIAGELPLAIGIVTIYFGFYRFARLLQLSTSMTRLWLVGLLSLGAIALVTLSPHNPGVAGNEHLFDIAKSLSIIEDIFYVFCAMLAWQISRVASKRYRASMVWSIAAMLTAFISAGLLLGTDYLPYPHWLTGSAISSTFILTNISCLIAAYTFNSIAAANQKQSLGNALVDSITLLASLVSKPDEVDTTLDRLRRVTAQHPTGTPFNDAENAQLQSVYRDLQQYLLTRERLRKFEKTEIDNLVQERYGLTIV
jgi:hypothetical protein